MSARRSFDHLLGAQQNRRRYVQAKRFGGLQIHHQLEFGWLMNRQIGGLLTLENPADVDTDLAKRVRDAASVAHQTA